MAYMPMHTLTRQSQRYVIVITLNHSELYRGMPCTSRCNSEFSLSIQTSYEKFSASSVQGIDRNINAFIRLVHVFTMLLLLGQPIYHYVPCSLLCAGILKRITQSILGVVPRQQGGYACNVQFSSAQRMSRILPLRTLPNLRVSSSSGFILTVVSMPVHRQHHS